MKLRKLFILLLFIPIVAAIEECLTVMEPIDIPCQVTTTWPYVNACNTYEAILFNENGIKIDQYTLSDFGPYCNFTFNHSEAGSYYFNISSGETGGLVIKYDMQLIYNLLIYAFYIVAVFTLIVFIHVFRKDDGTGFVYGMIATVLSGIMVALFLGGYTFIQGMTFIIDINYYLMALTAALGLYTSVISFNFHKQTKESQDFHMN